MSSVSQRLLDARKEAKKALWVHQSMRNDDERLWTEREIVDAWCKYNEAQQAMSDLEKQVRAVALAKVRLAKAEWWYYEGVHQMDQVTGYAREEAEGDARHELTKAQQALEELQKE